MLKFNPSLRVNPKDLLKNKIFDQCRKNYPNYEIEADHKILLDIDQPGVFDYEVGKSSKYTIPDLKQMMLTELQLYKNKL